MIICDLDLLDQLLLFLDVCFLLPAICCIVIVVVLLSVCQGLFLILCCSLIIFGIKSYHIPDGICLDDIFVNLSLFKLTKSCTHIIRISVTVRRTVITFLIGRACAGRCCHIFINFFTDLAEICCCILIELIKKFLDILLVLLRIIICNIVTADSYACIAESHLLIFLLIKLDICFCLNGILHLDIISLKFKEFLNIIFTYRKLRDRLICIGCHKVLRSFLDCLLLIVCDLYIILRRMLLLQAHLLNRLNRCCHCILAISLVRLIFHLGIPD